MSRLARMLLVVGATIAVAAIVWMLWPSGRTAVAPISDADLPRAPSPTDQQGSRDAAGGPIAGQSFQSAADAAQTTSRDGGLLVTVVNADQRPVVGAFLAAIDPTDAPPAADRHDPPAVATGNDGVARVPLDVPIAVAQLLVLARGYVPALVPVTNPTRQTVTLPGEPLLRGKVVVDGAPPGAPIKLSLQGYSDPTAYFGPAVQKLLGVRGFGITRIPFDADANGSFEVRGLTRGETCVVAVPKQYVFASGESQGGSTRIVTCDGTDLTLELRRCAILRGRVVWPAASPPPPGVLWLRYVLDVPPELGNPVEGAIPIEIDRPFEIFHPAPEIAAAMIEVTEESHPGRRWARRRIAKRIEGSGDLGDIVLDEPTRIAVTARNASGQPIADARSLALGHVSPRSGADGRMTAEVPPGAKALIVGAPRYLIQGFPLPDPLPASLEVTLEPACMLDVRVRPEDPAGSLGGLEIAVAYEVDGAAAAADSYREFIDVRIAKPERSSRQPTGRSGAVGIHGVAPGHQTWWYPVRPGENLIVSGFEKTDRPRVRVSDKYGAVLVDEGASFGTDGVAVMDLVVKTRTRTLRGRVVGDRGPIKNAKVEIFGWKETFTDASGSFELPDIHREDALLTVTAHGYVKRSVKAEEVLQSPTIALDRGRRLVVRLTGASDEKMEGRAILEIDGKTWERHKQAPDAFVFASVPCRPGTLRIVAPAYDINVAIGAEDTTVDVARPR